MPCDSLRPSLSPRSDVALRPNLLSSSGVALAMVLCTACNLPEKSPIQGTLTSNSIQSSDVPTSGSQQPPAVDNASGPSDFQQAAWPTPQSTPPPNNSAQTLYNAPPAWPTSPLQQQGDSAPQQAWPEGNVGISAGPPANNPLLQQGHSDVYDPTVTVATVGNLYVLRGDLVGEANVMLAPSVEKIPPEQLEAQRTEVLAARDQMARQLLNQAVERKLMYLEFLRSIPEDKRVEAEANIQERVGSAFNTDLEEMVEKVLKADKKAYAELAREDANIFRLALLMKQQNMATPIQLDNYLRRYGSSLDKQRQAFAERALGRQALIGAIETQPEVTHVEMLDFYNKRLDQFQVPDRAQWEQLTIRFDRFNSKDECRAAINAMGNEVWLGGARFDAVAKRSSQGTQAQEGGFHDWTEWGDLEVSREIQQAAFSFPPGELSPVIEDAEGLHIIRVIDRAEAHITPFTESQTAIKNKLQGQKRSVEITEFVAKLRKQTPIWTIYDDVGSDERRVADPSARPNASIPR
ncbi:MAG TPA: peptidylprolyl isomerase [Pirellulaceae bacterium]|nr:peptidylprolyl isomerase [Pirellulaceae bacterium]